MPAGRIPLSDLLASIRSEIVKADAAAKKEGTAVMQFDECEFEFAVEIEKEAKGGVHVWVLELSGGGKKTEMNTIRVKYKAGATAFVAPSKIGKEAPKPVRQ